VLPDKLLGRNPPVLGARKISLFFKVSCEHLLKKAENKA
jgi:hypothetical protein